MGRRVLVFAVVFFFLVILVSSVGFVDSSSDSYVRSQVLTFLEQVAGVDMSEVQEISFNVTSGTLGVFYSVPQTGVSGRVTYRNTDYSLAMVFEEEQFWFFSMTPFSINQTGPEVSLDDCLIIAENAITNYQAFFNASHCSGFAQMIPDTMQLSNFTAEEGNKLLEINCSGSAKQFNAVTLRWFEKVDGSKTPFMSTVMKISETGVVVSFVDNLSKYKVATTVVTVSETEAINAAMPYIESYAEENNRRIGPVEATFAYSVDITALRGDPHLIYPIWSVFGYFESSHEDHIVAYGVMLWADTGEVYHQGAQGYFDDSSQDIPSYSYIVIAAVVVSLFFVRLVLIKRRGKNQSSKTREIDSQN